MEALQRAMAQLVHRGPDSQRHWLAPNRRVGLGHTRLSIIDLTTGDQPIANEKETIRIIVNGEFYDFEGILQQRFKLRSGCDLFIPIRFLKRASSVNLHHAI